MMLGNTKALSVDRDVEQHAEQREQEDQGIEQGVERRPDVGDRAGQGGQVDQRQVDAAEQRDQEHRHQHAPGTMRESVLGERLAEETRNSSSSRSALRNTATRLAPRLKITSAARPQAQSIRVELPG